ASAGTLVPHSGQRRRSAVVAPSAKSGGGDPARRGGRSRRPQMSRMTRTAAPPSTTITRAKVSTRRNSQEIIARPSCPPPEVGQDGRERREHPVANCIHKQPQRKVTGAAHFFTTRGR